ncbi:hypothetical protein NSU_0086 [Novosphingobium pentaromativorans US6-1]|uniref:Uncharacterized protein n=1 Tax=Novosphingobium pentaromativorans US6-1 TaxID=1088721 RepID=G6E6W5_9SPHN|nr:hypothetical protein NSU_0086 [Novosphingobium pentaromativorans US6-1]
MKVMSLMFAHGRFAFPPWDLAPTGSACAHQHVTCSMRH